MSEPGDPPAPIDQPRPSGSGTTTATPVSVDTAVADAIVERLLQRMRQERASLDQGTVAAISPNLPGPSSIDPAASGSASEGEDRQPGMGRLAGHLLLVGWAAYIVNSTCISLKGVGLIRFFCL